MTAVRLDALAFDSLNRGSERITREAFTSVSDDRPTIRRQGKQ